METPMESVARDYALANIYAWPTGRVWRLGRLEGAELERPILEKIGDCDARKMGNKSFTRSL
jgi:hypothetical protein